MKKIKVLLLTALALVCSFNLIQFSKITSTYKSSDFGYAYGEDPDGIILFSLDID